MSNNKFQSYSPSVGLNRQGIFMEGDIIQGEITFPEIFNLVAPGLPDPDRKANDSIPFQGNVSHVTSSGEVTDFILLTEVNSSVSCDPNAISPPTSIHLSELESYKFNN